MMKGITTGTLLALSLLVLFASCATSSKPSPYQTVYLTGTVIQDVAKSKMSRTAAQRKISTALLTLEKQYNANNESYTIPESSLENEILIQPSPAWVRRSDGRVLVYIYSAYDTPLIPAMQDTVQRFIDTVNTFKNDSIPFIQTWIFLKDLEMIASKPNVKHIDLVSNPLLSQTQVEGGVRLRSDAALGLIAHSQNTGKPVKVGVLSDDCGSDSLLAISKAKGALDDDDGPLYGKDGAYIRSHEGLAMMEVVHDVDSTAHIRFATATGDVRGEADPSVAGMVTFANNIQALADSGCKVIVDDIQYFEEPAFYDGPLVKKINAISDSVVYIAAAGNWAQVTYTFKFKPLPHQTIGSMHSWQNFTVHSNPSDYNHEFELAEGQVLDAVLQWDDAFGASCNDFDVYLVDVASLEIVASSTDDQNGDGSNPFEHLYYVAQSCWGSKGYKLYVSHYASGRSGSDGLLIVDSSSADLNPTPRMKLLILGPNAEDDPPQDKSLFGHAAAESVIACGAIFAWENYNYTEIWSSRGNTDIVRVGLPVDPLSGNRPLYTIRKKPDVASLNAVSTTVPNFPYFWGTSAAAPHVAGIASLVLRMNPELSPDLVRTYIRGGALDYETPGVDNICGFGRADAFRSVAIASKAKDPNHIAAFQTVEPGRVAAIPISSSTVTSIAKLFVSATVDGYTTGSLILRLQRGTDPPILLHEFSSTLNYPNIVFSDRANDIVPAEWPAGHTNPDVPFLGTSGAFTGKSPSTTWKLILEPAVPGVEIKNWGLYIE